MQTWIIRAAGVVLTVFITTACGGGDTPTSPSPTPTASVTVTGLTIAPGADLLLLGESQDYAATATYSDGSSRIAAATWSSDNSGVVSVDARGRATAISAGRATLTAQADGRTATASVRGLPDFGGNWRVQVRTVTCDVPPRWGGGFCNVSGLVTMTLQLARAGGDRISGSVNNGIGWTGTVAGSVTTDGTLELTGRLTSVRPTVTFYSDYSDWRTRLSPTDGMTGGFREILTWTGERDQGFVRNEIVRATR